MDEKPQAMSTQVKVGAIIGSVIGLLALCLAVFNFGYDVGKDVNAVLIELQKTQIEKATELEKKLREELDLAKQELITNKLSAQTSLIGFGDEKAQQPNKAGLERLVLNAQNSAELFDGNLVISLIALSYEGNPLRHKVIASIGAPGKPNIELDRVDVGYSVDYEGYQIRVVASDTFTATFIASELSSQP